MGSDAGTEAETETLLGTDEVSSVFPDLLLGLLSPSIDRKDWQCLKAPPVLDSRRDTLLAPLMELTHGAIFDVSIYFIIPQGIDKEQK